MITDKERLAAEIAVGWDVPARVAEDALARWAHNSLEFLRGVLDAAVLRFADAGGRGIAMADEIDMLRVAIAVREIREGHGK